MLKFLQNLSLDEDIQRVLLAQLRNLWTHDSTAIEGNTLTLGETAFVLEEGLTISGKPLKDHQEVVGHARAIDLIYDMVERSTEITEEDIFLLHKAVQTTLIFDVYKPTGNWKAESNGTYIVDGERQIFFEYAAPHDVPGLMKKWIRFLNDKNRSTKSREEAISAYADLHIGFVWIHPFFDGNGRMARLLANLPVLKAGYPPVMIPKQKRQEYIYHLSRYSFEVSQPNSTSIMIPENNQLNLFRMFCKDSWKHTMSLIDNAQEAQEARDLKRPRC